jgi:glycine hydroxymethyltransferase
MLALDVREQGMGKAAALALESAHIICNFNLLPWDPLKIARNPSGLRLAVHEITRWGMGEEEMPVIAEFFRQILLNGKSPAKVRPVVKEFKERFDRLHYCFA